MDAEIKKMVDAAVANAEANCGVKYTQFGDGFTRADLMDENRRLLAQGNYVFCNVPKSGFIEKISQ